MKLHLTIILLLLPAMIWAQKADTTANKSYGKFRPYARKATTLTLSVGIADQYKAMYKLPDGFVDGAASGFAPVYFKVERTVSNHISIAVNIMYDAFYYNYAQTGSGNGVSFLRYQRDNVSAFSGGLIGYYHFTQLRVPNLDLFVGVGGTINRIKHTAYPQGDSTASFADHTVSPHLKVGARYYINKYISLFGDVGYDQISIGSLGLSCRFY